MRAWPLFLTLALTACGASKSEPTASTAALTSASVNDDGLAVVLCDKVVSFSATSLILGSGGWKIAEDAALAHTELLVKDATVCAHLRFDDDHEIEALDVEPAPVGDPWADIENAN